MTDRDPVSVGDETSAKLRYLLINAPVPEGSYWARLALRRYGLEGPTLHPDPVSVPQPDPQGGETNPYKALLLRIAKWPVRTGLPVFRDAFDMARAARALFDAEEGPALPPPVSAEPEKCWGCAKGLPLLPEGSTYNTRKGNPEHFNGSLQVPCQRAEGEPPSQPGEPLKPVMPCLPHNKIGCGTCWYGMLSPDARAEEVAREIVAAVDDLGFNPSGEDMTAALLPIVYAALKEARRG